MDREGDVFVSLTDQDPRDVWEVMIALFDLEGFFFLLFFSITHVLSKALSVASIDRNGLVLHHHQSA